MVKRYTSFCKRYGNTVHPDAVWTSKTGEWVKYTDYEALEKERDRLRNRWNRLQPILLELADEDSLSLACPPGASCEFFYSDCSKCWRAWLEAEL
jgi:hypothetical protein